MSSARSSDALTTTVCGSKLNVFRDGKIFDQPRLRTPIMQHSSSHGVNSIAFSPDDKIIASCSDHIVKLWAASNGALLNSLEGGHHGAAILSLAFSPNENRLASGGSDNTVVMWCTKTMSMLHVVLDEGHSASVRALAFAHDGTILASGSDDHTIILWDVAAQSMLYCLTADAPVVGVAFCPRGGTLATVSEGAIELWDVKDGDFSCTFFEVPRDEIMCISYSPCGSMIAAVRKHMITVLSEVTRAVILSLHFDAKSVAFSPDAKLLLVGGAVNGLALFNVASGILLHTLRSHVCPVNCVAFSADGTMIASGGTDGKINRHGIKTTALQVSVDVDRTTLCDVGLSPDNSTVFATMHNGGATLWNVGDGSLIMHTQGDHINVIHSVTFSNTSHVVAFCSMDAVSVHHVPSRLLLSKISGKGFIGPNVEVAEDVEDDTIARVTFTSNSHSEELTDDDDSTSSANDEQRMYNRKREVCSLVVRLPDMSMPCGATMLQAQQKISALRLFLATPVDVFGLLCTTFREVVSTALSTQKQQDRLNAIHKMVEDWKRKLLDHGISENLLKTLSAPTEACRTAMLDSDALHVVVEAKAAFQQFSLEELPECLETTTDSSTIPTLISTSNLPYYLQAFWVASEAQILKLLQDARNALQTFDSHSTHIDAKSTKNSLEAIFAAHTMFLSSTATASLSNSLSTGFSPQDAVLNKRNSCEAQARAMFIELSSWVPLLCEFEHTAAAFHRATKMFATGTNEAAAKIDELHQLRELLLDTQVDCDIANSKLKRRTLSDANREQLQMELLELRKRVTALREDYLQRHRVALKVVFKFFPELQSTFVDPNDFINSIPQFDPTMSMNSFDDITRSTTDASIDSALLNGKQVVVKHFTKKQVSTFQRECSAYSSVQNPFVGEMIAAFSDDDGLATVMPQYQGGTADTWAARHIDTAFLIVRLMRQVADGLKCLHLAKVTHCDFKPQNVVMSSVSTHAVPKIIDFGCADVEETTALLVDRMGTQTLSTLAGYTPQYVAPEVVTFLSNVTTSTSFATDSNEKLTRIIHPAIDIYAFGRWMSEILQSPSCCESTFELPSGDDDSRVAASMLTALDPFRAPLEALVNQCLSNAPLKRPSASEIAYCLHNIEQKLQTENEATHVHNHEVLECCICSCEVKRKNSICCKVPLGHDAVHDGHAYCRECLRVMLQDWQSKPIPSHVSAKGTVTCSYGSCSGLLDQPTLLKLLPETLDRISYVQKAVSEFLAIQDVKRRLENESLEQRAIREVDENILGIRCPKCDIHCDIDFSECMAMTCPHCRSNFCGYCMADCGDDAHAHVTKAHPNEQGLGLFTTHECWYEFRYNHQLEKMNQYLRTVPDEVATAVRNMFPSPSPS